MIIEIKHRFSGAVLFSHDVAKNYVAITLVAAISAGADLRSANLRSANLYGADLQGADLRSADLQGADLQGADLRSANLYGADLQGANLRSADLYGANLRSANLYGADLRSANLRSANLQGADLQGADLQGANYKKALHIDLVIAQTRILPQEGAIIGFKKCQEGVLVKLLIPSSAKRSHAMGRKCRAEYAQVLEVLAEDGGVAEYGISQHDGKTKYVVGKTVHCDQWGEDWTVECAGGIHFFTQRIEAVNY